MSVVALFNAIEKHQHLNGNRGEDKSDARVKSMSKENFLGLLQASQHTTADASAKTSWAVVRDDFMMDAKLKDWDNQHGTELGRVRHEGDDDVEAVEDVAWKKAADALESDVTVSSDRRKPSKRRLSSSAGEGTPTSTTSSRQKTKR